MVFPGHVRLLSERRSASWENQEPVIRCSDVYKRQVDGSDNTCVFENLTSARYYRVTCEGEADLPLTISEGRIVSFWYSLGEIVNTLLGR